MKRFWIEHLPTMPVGPMTFWVHRAVDDRPWHLAEEFDPPRPGSVAGLGYPVLHVECDGFTFTFASVAELDVCIETLHEKLLRRTLDLSRRRGTGVGPNSPWLSRLPSRVKAWGYRDKAVRYLRDVRSTIASGNGL